jgi:hypothetical protein
VKIRHIVGLACTAIATILACTGFHYHLGGLQVLGVLTFTLGLAVHSAEDPIR